MMNSPTKCDADGRDSHKNGGDKKSDFSSDYISNGALQFKTRDESGGAGDGKEVELFEAAQSRDTENNAT